MSGTRIILGRWIVTGGGSDDATLSDGAVAMEGDRIVAVGDRRRVQSQYPDAEVSGGDHTAVMPGLINAHHHSHGTSTFQHGIPDDLLEPWILSFVGMRPGDTYLETLISSARQLRGGVTTVVDVHSYKGEADGYRDSVDAGLKAYDESGLRVAFATGVTLQSLIVHGEGEDERFLGQLPADLAAATRALKLGRKLLSGDEYLDVVAGAIARYAGHPRIEVWFAPPGPQWVSDELMVEIAQRAEQLDVGVQTHCNESIYEMMQSPKFKGLPTVLHLERLGVLSDRFSIAHGVWLKESEIAVLASTGAAVSHNPSSNLRLRAGIAPLNALLAAGVTVGVGMDGTTLNEDEDMFTEMRLVMRLHRTPILGTPAPESAKVLELATSGSARLMRREHELGRIAPGYKADLVVLDLKDIAWPWVAENADPRELLLMRARGGDVKDVYVNGERVLADGRPTRFDLQAAGEALAERLKSHAYPREAAALVAKLTPHLERWYCGWQVPPLDPYIRYNSRI